MVVPFMFRRIPISVPVTVMPPMTATAIDFTVLTALDRVSTVLTALDLASTALTGLDRISTAGTGEAMGGEDRVGIETEVMRQEKNAVDSMPCLSRRRLI